VEDAIFAGRYALLKRKQLLTELQAREDFVEFKQQYFDSLKTLMEELKLSKTRAIKLLDGKMELDDLFADGKGVVGDE
jgi:hypothetical protein